jgi:hypothetical protein
MELTNPNIHELNFDEIDFVSGSASLGEAILIGAGTGGLIAGMGGANPPGIAAGALIGGVVAIGLYYL